GQDGTSIQETIRIQYAVHMDDRLEREAIRRITTEPGGQSALCTAYVINRGDLPDASKTATARRDCRSTLKPPGPGDRQHHTVRIVDVGGEPTGHCQNPSVGAHGAVHLQDVVAAIDLEVLLISWRSLEVPRSYDVDRMLVEPMPAQEDRVAAEKADRNDVL